MAHITTTDVEKVAALSGFTLTPQEIAAYQAQFEEIIGYINRLNDIDVSGLEPTYQVTGLRNVMREDEIIDYGVPQTELLKNAPDQQDGYIKVKRVMQ